MRETSIEKIYRGDSAFTYTLSDFVDTRYNNNVSYRDVSILDIENGIEFIDHNLIDEYMEYLEPLALSIELTDQEYLKYRYAPDLISYDLYGTVLLDYIILAINGTVDPKEFDKRVIKVIRAEDLQLFFDEMLQNDNGYLRQNRLDQGLPVYF